MFSKCAWWFCLFHCLSALEIEIDGACLQVEMATTVESRTRGLSGRKDLPEGTGMLFVYEEPRICYFWMKDIQIPLSIGFFDTNRVLIDWTEMSVPEKDRPKLTIYKSPLPALYALEVPKGWFTTHKIKSGAVLNMKYTESDSKIGQWQGGAPNLSQAKPTSKQLNLHKLSDADGLKDGGCPTQPEPIFESRAV